MIRRAFIGILLSAAACVNSLAQQDINIKIVDRGERLNVPVYRVAVTSDNPDLLNGAKRAFGLHGSYILTTPGKGAIYFFVYAGRRERRKGGHSRRNVVRAALYGRKSHGGLDEGLRRRGA